MNASLLLGVDFHIQHIYENLGSILIDNYQLHPVAGAVYLIYTTKGLIAGPLSKSKESLKMLFKLLR